MKVYYCWITVLTAAYLDAFIASMAKKSYMIGSITKDGKIVAPGEQSSAVLAVRIYKTEEVDLDKVYDDVAAALKENKAYYHSIVISEAAASRWTGSNFNLNPPVPEPQPSKKTMN